MTDKYLLNACVNPLCFFEADDAWSGLIKAEVTTDHVVKYACAPDESAEIDQIVDRYKQISRNAKNIVAAPAETKILQKLIWPLRHAKRAYMLGNYLGTIAMCGLVSEMIAILIFEISRCKLNNEDITEDKQKKLFGRSFENLGQERRVEVLRGYEIIDDKLKSKFDVIRTKRKRYLHLWSEDHECLAKDAIIVYDAAVGLVLEVIGQQFQDGKLLLNPALVTYLRRAGAIKPGKAQHQDQA